MKFSIHQLTTNYTDVLSAYIKNLTYDQIPAEVIDRAKKIAMQTIGVAIAANGVPRAFGLWPPCSVSPLDMPSLP